MYGVYNMRRTTSRYVNIRSRWDGSIFISRFTLLLLLFLIGFTTTYLLCFHSRYICERIFFGAPVFTTAVVTPLSGRNARIPDNSRRVSFEQFSARWGYIPSETTTSGARFRARMFVYEIRRNWRLAKSQRGEHVHATESVAVGSWAAASFIYRSEIFFNKNERNSLAGRPCCTYYYGYSKLLPTRLISRRRDEFKLR